MRYMTGKKYSQVFIFHVILFFQDGTQEVIL